MVKALFDTNILIDYLNGFEMARTAIERFEDKAISIIPWMEVMIGTNDENQLATKQFLATFELVLIDEIIATKAVELRKAKRIKLPDAIIWSSALTNDRVLVTRNTKDFAKDELGVFVPYAL